MTTLNDRLLELEGDEDEAFLRRYVIPEEDRPLFSTPYRGGYRWFRSANIVCLEKYRGDRKRRSST